MITSERKQKVLFIAISIVLFFFIFFLNGNTSYVWDDYVYKLRFDNGQHLTEFSQIFPSLNAHARLYNGRLVAHFFAHLFLLLPKPVFNVLNSMMYMLMCLMIFKFSGARVSSRFGWLFLLCVFSAVWLEAPCYGQVFLWLDGACNYLWGIGFNLLFIAPFWSLYTQDRHIRSPLLKILILPFAFICGAFQENSSVSAIFISSLLILLCLIRKKTKVEIIYYISIFFSVLGLLFMATRPAEATKMTNFSIEGFLSALNSVYWSFRHMWKPYFIYVVAFSISLFLRQDNEVLISSLILFLGAICANGIMLFASFYPGRCALPSAILIISADAVLIYNLLYSKVKYITKVFLIILLVAAVYTGVGGVTDIVETNREIQVREQMILESKNQGVLDIRIPMLGSRTKYSPLYLELAEYVSASPEGFSNHFMAIYYGVNSISGYYP